MENIRVVVRIRPLFEFEFSRGDTPILFARDARNVQVGQSSNGKQGVGNKCFTYNGVFDETTTQDRLFGECGVKDLLNSTLEGYSSTVFCYGQTGSGKTFTLSGKEEVIASQGVDRAEEVLTGLIPRSIAHIYNRIDGAPSNEKYTVSASYLEIWNEQIYDLLNASNQPLHVRWGSRQNFFVENLFVVECATREDLMAVFLEGTKNRTVRSHELNKDSSRSHSLMTIYVQHVSTDPSDAHTITRFGKAAFVDLAGSERLKESKAANDGTTGAINKSLFTLGQVIAALSGSGSSRISPPYRDSKLTKLLMDSLGGNSMALMIACCSPSSRQIEESISTLTWAARTSTIRNRPVVQMDPNEQLILSLRRENQLLRNENLYLQQSLAAVYNNNNNNNGQSPFPPLPLPSAQDQHPLSLLPPPLPPSSGKDPFTLFQPQQEQALNSGAPPYPYGQLPQQQQQGSQAESSFLYPHTYSQQQQQQHPPLRSPPSGGGETLPSHHSFPPYNTQPPPPHGSYMLENNLTESSSHPSREHHPPSPLPYTHYGQSPLQQQQQQHPLSQQFPYTYTPTPTTSTTKHPIDIYTNNTPSRLPPLTSDTRPIPSPPSRTPHLDLMRQLQEAFVVLQMQAMEIDATKQENADLREMREAMERDFRGVLYENEELRMRLDTSGGAQAEGIDIGGGGDAGGRQRGSTASRLSSAAQQQDQSGRGGSSAREEELRGTIDKLRNENNNLSIALQNLQTLMSRRRQSTSTTTSESRTGA